MAEEHRALILETLSPAERFDALMNAVGQKEDAAAWRDFLECGMK